MGHKSKKTKIKSEIIGENNSFLLVSKLTAEVSWDSGATTKSSLSNGSIFLRYSIYILFLLFYLQKHEILSW